MQLLFHLFLWGLFQGVCSVSFIDPSDAGKLPPQDYSADPVFAMGSTLRIQWSLEPTEQNQLLDLIMWQDVAGSKFEYIGKDLASNTTSFNWNVSTAKDLGVSHAFFFDLYLEPTTIDANVANEDARSHYINITSAIVPTTSTTTASSTTSSSSSVTAKTSTASVTTSPTTSATAVPIPASDGLSTGAKIGLGLGVPIVVIALIAIGWLIFGRRKQKHEAMPRLSAYSISGEVEKSPPYSETKPGFVTHPGLIEAPSPNLHSSFVEATTPVPGRYEM
ncbi:uncharacterized protein PAC_14607 [Phialocephala subalpina]|uniref:Mid2 domain-containing protein n=1 Tax=Phialocephala subalpina TaxID=576137 RepID=A0A1L7XI66_9HELO|nr:uncharacterized protein PAC_14607 [Phialocephala subalpina]